MCMYAIEVTDRIDSVSLSAIHMWDLILAIVVHADVKFPLTINDL